MWQRRQTLWMVLAIIAMILSIFLPYKAFEIGTETGHLKLMDETAKLILAAGIAGLLFVNILGFANRPRQLKMGFFITGLIVALVVWMFLSEAEEGVEKIQPAIGMLMPLLALFLNNMALKGIWRDEKLVKSADRMR